MWVSFRASPLGAIIFLGRIKCIQSELLDTSQYQIRSAVNFLIKYTRVWRPFCYKLPKKRLLLCLRWPKSLPKETVNACQGYILGHIWKFQHLCLSLTWLSTGWIIRFDIESRYFVNLFWRVAWFIMKLWNFHTNKNRYIVWGL